MNRRRFAFWLSFGLFSLAERTRVAAFDRWAAAVVGGPAAGLAETPIHWTVASNARWWWYERQTWDGGQWVTTGITRPLDKQTGAPLEDADGYLDETVVPRAFRVAGRRRDAVIRGEASDVEGSDQTDFAGRPSQERRARHGRPPSQWLRSLQADELRIWLKTIDVPEAGVSGMTYWVHLTRDHAFDPSKIEGLSEEEQAQLHAAAHYGY